MRLKNKRRYFLPLALVFTLSGLSFISCSKKSEVTEEGAGGGGFEISDQVGPGKSVACTATGVVGPQGTEITPVVDKTPYPYSYGSVHPPYINTVAFNGDFVATAVGSWVGAFNGTTPLGVGVDLKGGQVLALKFFEKDGTLSLIAGTMSNLQVCTVDKSNGVQADSCKVFDRVGGVNNVDVRDNNIYFTTLAGDFGSIGWDMMQSQSGCARLYYLASENPSAKTKTNFRAFRVSAGNSVVFVTRNNSGSAVPSLNTFIANMMDWTDAAYWRILDRETKLYSLNPADGKVTPLDFGNPAYQFHVDDLVAGPGGKIFASYWAPRVEDIELIRACKATPPGSNCGMQTPHADIVVAVLSYFLNTESGILTVDGTTVTPHNVTPFANFNAANGCPAEGLGQWLPTFPTLPPPVCARIPNFGLYFFNRLSTAGDSVYMRGITGYVRLKGDTLEEKSASTLPVPAGEPGSGLAFAFGANPTYSAAMGVFANIGSGGYASETATYGGTPMSLSTTALFSIYNDPTKLDMYLVGGGSHYAYVDYDSDTRSIDVLDQSKTVLYKLDYTDPNGATATLPHRDGNVSAQENPNSPGKDRFITWNPKYDPTPLNNVSNVAFYESDDPNPKFVASFPAPGIKLGSTPDRPVLLHGDFAFGVQNIDTSGTQKHRFAAAYVDWNQKKSVLSSYSYVELPNSSYVGLMNVDQSGDDYKIYVDDNQLNVHVISLHHNQSNYYNDPTKPNTDFFDAAPTPVMVSHSGAVGAAAGDGQVYFLDKDGNIQVYSASGGFVKTISKAIPLFQGESVMAGISTSYHGGKVFTTAAVAQGPTSPLPNGVRFNFNIIDVTNGANVISYDFNYFIIHLAGDKVYAGSYYNGSDVFDMSITPAQSSFQGSSINVGGGTP